MSYTQALEELLRLQRVYGKEGERDDPEAEPMPSHAEGVRFMLQQCEPFYWSPDIARMIEQIPTDGLEGTVLHEEMLHTAGAFWWLARPIALPPWDGDGTHMRAVAYARYSSFIEFRTFHHFWGLANDIDALTLVKWNFGQPLRDAIARSYDGISSAGAPEDAWQREAVLRFAAMLLFIQQRILVTPMERPERHARKRLLRTGYAHEPLIGVVELRRKQAKSEPSADHEAVDWSHQWIVSGHWRQQWYPSINANQPRWIMPYLKGPEDKPLKPPRAKVFAVVR